MTSSSASLSDFFLVAKKQGQHSLNLRTRALHPLEAHFLAFLPFLGALPFLLPALAKRAVSLELLRPEARSLS